MKRYLLFVFAEYYPGGGWDDFVGSFDTPEEAVAAGVKEDDIAKWGDMGAYLQVVDATTGEIHSKKYFDSIP